MEALTHWLAYSDYYYYKGVVIFDSYEELFQKIKSADLHEMQKNALQHRLEKNIRNHLNYRAINKYFFSDDGDDHHIRPYDGDKNKTDDSEGKQPYLSKTLEEGMSLWTKKISRPNLSSKLNQYACNKNGSKGSFYGQRVTLINYGSDNQVDCNIAHDGNMLIFYTFNQEMSHTNNLGKLCIFIDIIKIQNISEISEIIQSHQSLQTDNYAQLLIMLIYAIKNGASNVNILSRNPPLSGCKVPSKFASIIPNDQEFSWLEYNDNILWTAWIPIPDEDFAKLWLQKVCSQTESISLLRCINYKSVENLLPSYEQARLKMTI